MKHPIKMSKNNLRYIYFVELCVKVQIEESYSDSKNRLLSFGRLLL